MIIKKNILKLVIAGIAILFAFSSCKKKGGLAMANEVCDCKMKTKGMSIISPERIEIWNKCLKIESSYFIKLQKDKEQLDIFNKKRNECLKEILGDDLF